MVPLSDPKCPQDTRNALRRDAPTPVSVDQQINNDSYNAANGLVPGDSGYRQP